MIEAVNSNHENFSIVYDQGSRHVVSQQYHHLQWYVVVRTLDSLN